MPENDRFSGRLDDIGLKFVERDVTPSLPKLRIRFRFARLLISDTVSFLEVFGVEGPDPPFITGFTKGITDQEPVRTRTTSG